MTNGRIRTCEENYDSVLEALEELARAAHELKSEGDRNLVSHCTLVCASRLRIIRNEKRVYT